jgi:membrane-bound ClpP family serine protease
MTPATLAILLVLAGVVLLVAEMLLPTQGILGAIGAAALVGCVVVCFRIDSRMGFGVMVAMVVAAPFAGMLWVKLWPRTPVGRRMILSPVSGGLSAVTIDVGQQGVTVSELRPMGVCEFGAERIEARAERGTIPPGSRVQVVEIVDRRPTVRALQPSTVEG